MAVLNADDRPSAARPRRPRPHKAPLFMRSIVPHGAVVCSLSCSLIPPHALRRSHSTVTAVRAPRQLVVVTATSIHVHDVDDAIVAMYHLADVMVFTDVYDVAAIPTPIPGRDALVVLSRNGMINYLHFDEQLSTLRCLGSTSLDPYTSTNNNNNNSNNNNSNTTNGNNNPNTNASTTLDTSHNTMHQYQHSRLDDDAQPPPTPAAQHHNTQRMSASTQPRLLAVHARRNIVAVASLKSQIAIFPLLFLPKTMRSGKVANIAVDGLILSLDFLATDNDAAAASPSASPPRSAEHIILAALVQRGNDQMITLYSINIHSNFNSVLFIVPLGSMITCARHPDDLAVAKATAKIAKATGQELSPTPPPASGIAKLPDCPYLFAVFVAGKVIVADARSIVYSALYGDEYPINLALDHNVDDTPSVIRHNPAPESPKSSDTPLLPPSSGNATPTGARSTPPPDGFITPVHQPVRRDVPNAPLQTRRPVLRGMIRHDIPIPPALGPRAAHAGLVSIGSISAFQLGAGAKKGSADHPDYLPYLYVPSYVSRDMDEADGVVTSWTCARNHFAHTNEDDHDPHSGGGIYFVMQSGALHVLRWSSDPALRDLPSTNKDGGPIRFGFSSSACSARTSSSSAAPPSSETREVRNAKALSRTTVPPHPSFSLEYVGDVGPAHSIAALDRRLLYVANDGCDGSLRRVIAPDNPLPQRPAHDHGLNRRLSGRADAKRYGLEVRQEFLNLSPISDFIIAPPTPPPPLSPPTAGTSVRLSWAPGIDPARNESEIIAACGIGRHGTLRFIRPGAPVSVFAASPPSDAPCTAMWALRFVAASPHHRALVLSYVQASRALLIAPYCSDPESAQFDGEELLDGTAALQLVADRATLVVDRLQDSLLAQVHADGVRLIYLKSAGVRLPTVRDGVLTDSLCDRVVDWRPPSGGFVSAASVRNGFILLAVVNNALASSALYLLKCDPTLGIIVAASAQLDKEVSTVHIADWASQPTPGNPASPHLPPLALIGTYAPALELRVLGPALERVVNRPLLPWTADPARRARLRDRADVRTTLDAMTAVPESIVTVERAGRRLVFVGLRDGSVLQLSLADRPLSANSSATGSATSPRPALSLEAHRRLGSAPVALALARVALGPVVLAQAERPWAAAYAGGAARPSWLPLAFPQTRALCHLSVPKAEHCFAAIADDNAFYICGLRRRAAVSVRTALVGATPRRVLAPDVMPAAVVVAADAPDPAPPDARARLLLFDRASAARRASLPLLPAERVHVLLNWAGFVVAGTSLGSASYHDAGAHRMGKRGRLLLLTMIPEGSRYAFELCCEMVLPGAILCGAVSDNQDFLTISCHREVLVFTLIPVRNVMVQVARTAARTVVVALAIKDDIVAIVDQQDSVGFFQLQTKYLKLVLDRHDHTRRLISDGLLVDRTLSFAVDRFGGLFSIGYPHGDHPPKINKNHLKSTAIKSPILRTSLQNSDHSQQSQQHHPAHGFLEDNDGRNHGNLNETGANEDDHDPMNDAVFEDAQQVQGALNDGNVEIEEVDNDNDSHPQHHSVNNNQADGGAQNSDEDAIIEDQAPLDEDSGDDHVDEGANAAFVAGVWADADSLDGNEMAVEDEEVEEDDNGAANELDDDFIMDSGDDHDDNEGDGNVNNNNNDAPQGLGNGMQAEAEAAQPPPPPTGNNSRNNKARIPRNLVSHHSYNMRDVALRVRLGTFRRAEADADDEGARGFLGTPHSGVFCATLGGAIVAGVDMPPDAFALLEKVEYEMGAHPEIAQPALDSSHRKARAAYGPRAVGTVDGDLLASFHALSEPAKIDIAQRVGLADDDDPIVLIEGLIQQLCDRVL